MERILSFLFLVALVRFLLLIVTKKSHSVSKAFRSSIITFFASFGYLLAIQENMRYYQDAIPKIRFLPAILGLKEISVAKSLPIYMDPTIPSIIGNYLNSYTSFFIFFAVYYVVVKNGRKFKIDYFIRYNVMHSILIMLIQVPLTFAYVECKQYISLNKILLMFLRDLANGIIIFNFAVIFYGMAHAMVNSYTHMPIITDAAKLHIGKKERLI